MTRATIYGLVAATFPQIVGCGPQVTPKSMARFPQSNLIAFNGRYQDKSVDLSRSTTRSLEQGASLWACLTDAEDSYTHPDDPDEVEIRDAGQDGFTAIRIINGIERDRRQIRWKYSRGYIISPMLMQFRVQWIGPVFSFNTWGLALDHNGKLRVSRENDGFGFLFWVFPIGGHGIGQTDYLRLRDKKEVVPAPP